jgi:hypothetical protein
MRLTISGPADVDALPDHVRMPVFRMVRVHIDTDLGGDPDDACALAFLLGWPKYRVAS